MRPGAAAVCVSAAAGPPGATQSGWEIRIPYCCIADMLSHHMLGSCWGLLKSGTSCLHFMLSDDFKGAITILACRLQSEKLSLLLHWLHLLYLCSVLPHNKPTETFKQK